MNYVFIWSFVKGWVKIYKTWIVNLFSKTRGEYIFAKKGVRILFPEKEIAQNPAKRYLVNIDRP